VTSNRVIRVLAAPVLAIALAGVVSALLLIASGNSPGDILQVVTDEGFTVRSLIATLNRAAPYYLAGVAVAIGFKMNLFNIGVEGQYRLAALVAAAVGAAVTLPAPLHLAVILLTAMLVGMAWASIAGVLRATRGVSEVISTIMLNAIALGLTPYLLERFFRRPKKNATDYAKVTETIPPSGRFPSLNSAIDKIGIDVPQGSSLQSYIFVAAVVGVLYYLLVWRTRFGFDLRASGWNPFAAAASGVSSRRMIIVAMALSGAIAGLVGLNSVLSTTGYYSADVVFRGLGFTGIAIALLGRNNPVGIAVAALLWAFMDVLQTPLARAELPKEIVPIMQAIIVLSVVIAYEVIRRLVARQQAQEIAGELQHQVAPA
jgi:general nucleoside transport system permease protein